MTTRDILAVTAAVLALATASGSAVTRGQEPVGAYLDDPAITTSVKARFVDNKTVDASAIGVETTKGTVMLSGLARSSEARAGAEAVTHKVDGVVAVKNEIAVRP